MYEWAQALNVQSWDENAARSSSKLTISGKMPKPCVLPFLYIYSRHLLDSVSLCSSIKQKPGQRERILWSVDEWSEKISNFVRVLYKTRNWFFYWFPYLAPYNATFAIKDFFHSLPAIPAHYLWRHVLNTSLILGAPLRALSVLPIRAVAKLGWAPRSEKDEPQQGLARRREGKEKT